MTVLSPAEVDASLSKAMREGSAQEHKDAEGSGFMEALLGGKLNAAGYADYLGRLRLVYVALENVPAEVAADVAVQAVRDADLERLAAIDADLAFWNARAYGDAEVPAIVSPAAQAYAARVEQARSWGGLFVAHHYTRYMGDLSGGQAIGRLLARQYELADNEGVAFYDFTEIPKPKIFKDGYRARLDDLDYTPEEKQRVVDEVKVAFNLNQALFEELGADMPRYLV